MLRWKMAGMAEQRHHGKVSEEVDGTGASHESHIWKGSELASHSQSDVKSLEVFNVATPLGLFYKGIGCCVRDRLKGAGARQREAVSSMRCSLA